MLFLDMKMYYDLHGFVQHCVQDKRNLAKFNTTPLVRLPKRNTFLPSASKEGIMGPELHRLKAVNSTTYFFCMFAGSLLTEFQLKGYDMLTCYEYLLKFLRRHTEAGMQKLCPDSPLGLNTVPRNIFGRHSHYAFTGLPVIHTRQEALAKASVFPFGPARAPILGVPPPHPSII